MKKQAITSFIIVITLLMIFVSCTPEKQIAKKFLEKEDYGSILIISPEILYLTNKKIDEIDNIEVKDQYTIDSLLFYNSKFLQFVSDSIFVEKYINNMLEEFQKLGFDTYTEEYFDVFLSRESPSYILNIAQLEAEESIKTITEQDFINNLAYIVNIEVNMVTINSWLEFSAVNSNDNKKEVLFADHFVSDNVHGVFNESLFSSDVQYQYELDSMKVEDIYDLGAYLGRLYASYIFDYIMNKKIENEFDLKSRPPDYLHYDRIRNRLYINEENSFIVVD